VLNWAIFLLFVTFEYDIDDRQGILSMLLMAGREYGYWNIYIPGISTIQFRTAQNSLELNQGQTLFFYYGDFCSLNIRSTKMSKGPDKSI
jgi:hypothetical protein